MPPAASRWFNRSTSPELENTKNTTEAQQKQKEREVTVRTSGRGIAATQLGVK